eukprot:1357721-Prymnesium_polylepis.1
MGPASTIFEVMIPRSPVIAIPPRPQRSSEFGERHVASRLVGLEALVGQEPRRRVALGPLELAGDLLDLLLKRREPSPCLPRASRLRRGLVQLDFALERCDRRLRRRGGVQ